MSRRREVGRGWLAIAAILAVACAALAVLVVRQRHAAESVRADARREAEASVRDQTARLAGRLTALESQAAALRDSVQHLSARVPSELPEPEDVAELEKRGLADPIADLRADLQRHPELIPYPGVSGGRMGFYDASAIHVLDDRWVYAEFDDGHIAGVILLECTVRDGRIAWRRLTARLNA